MYQPKPIYKLLDGIDINMLNLRMLCANPNPTAISLLEANPDKLDIHCWENLSCNPSAIPLLEKNPDKITPTGKKNETKFLLKK